MAKGGVPWHGPLGCAGVPSRWENKGDCEMGNSVLAGGLLRGFRHPRWPRGGGPWGRRPQRALCHECASSLAGPAPAPAGSAGGGGQPRAGPEQGGTYGWWSGRPSRRGGFGVGRPPSGPRSPAAGPLAATSVCRWPPAHHRPRPGTPLPAPSGVGEEAVRGGAPAGLASGTRGLLSQAGTLSTTHLLDRKPRPGSQHTGLGTTSHPLTLYHHNPEPVYAPAWSSLASAAWGRGPACQCPGPPRPARTGQAKEPPAPWGRLRPAVPRAFLDASVGISFDFAPIWGSFLHFFVGAVR